MYQCDPTHSALIRAVQISFPGIVGLCCWMFFRKPFSAWIIMLPAYLFMIIFIVPTPKQKILNVVVCLFLLAVLQFSFAVLRIHPYILVSFLFIISLISLSSVTYRSSAIFAVLCSVIYLELSPGWYLGVNRIIEIVISGLIAVGFIVIYDYLFSIVQLKGAIVYFSELLGDTFYSLTSSDSKKTGILNHKYIFDRPLSFKAEFEVEKILKTDEEKFSHRLGMELINKSRYIEKEKFIFKKNRDCRDYMYVIYILFKNVYRNFAFMLKFNHNKNEIYKHFPSTQILIKNINDVFKKIYLFFRKDCSTGPFFNEEFLNKWKAECERVSSKNNVIDDEILDSIYGLKCLISDLKEIETILQAKQKVTH